MKKLLIVGALVSALAACSTAQQQTAQGDLAKLQTTVVNGCMVVQPVLVSIAALDPTVGAASVANGLFCAAASSITVTSVQSAISTGIPAISTAVDASTLIPADKKPIVAGALGVFQLLLTNALAVYGAPVSTASAPVAASQ
jgi:hypothetical protein